MPSRNQYHKARSVLESLILGVDPESGDELPEEDIVNRIEVNRSLTTALAAIEQVEARMMRRALLPESVGKNWTKEEELQLAAEFAKSEPISSIAERHGRTVRAIEARAQRLGLLRPDERTTTDSFTGN